MRTDPNGTQKREGRIEILSAEDAQELMQRGMKAIEEGDFGSAGSHYSRSLEAFHELGDKMHVVASLMAFAQLAILQGQAERALCLLGALTIWSPKWARGGRLAQSASPALSSQGRPHRHHRYGRKDGE